LESPNQDPFPQPGLFRRKRVFCIENSNGNKMLVPNRTGFTERATGMFRWDSRKWFGLN
jgi:hypothetical protein